MSSETPGKKILILAANPKGTTERRLDEEVREIETGLQRAKHRQQFILEQRWAVRPRDIQRAMLDFNPQIIHFSGNGDEGLVFEDETGQAKLVEEEALAELFELFADQVECVVLNGCYSEVQAEAIIRHINYVIGMKKPIGDRAAIEFAVGFYDALGAGRNVEFAHRSGQVAMKLAGSPKQLVSPILKKKPNIEKMVAKISLPNDQPPVPNEPASEPSTEPIEVFFSYAHEVDTESSQSTLDLLTEEEPQEQEQITDELITIPKLETEDGQPTLYSLWEASLKLELPDGELDANSTTFLEVMWRQKPKLMGSGLTELQKQIWQHCQDFQQSEQPFHSDRNVIIAAPTSSGKSTVAEMFLVGPPLRNDRRKCSLYIAPTRALTQAKHRELQALFAEEDEMRERIVLSTGEDTTDDWRINSGQFDIVCMVYEKANILFSQKRQLLDKLGCIVVDEMHMLMDLERGPILEMALTKAIVERKAIDSRLTNTPTKETIRIVTISTEGPPDPTIVQFLSVRELNTGRIVKPLWFYDDSREVIVKHSFILPSKEEKLYEEFTFLEFNSTEKRQLSDRDIRAIDTRLSQQSKKNQFSQSNTERNNNKNKSKDRLEKLLIDLLLKHDKGYRILVFVPGREEAEGEAGRLKNALTKRARGKLHEYLGDKSRHTRVLNRLDPHLVGMEDKRMAKMVKECAEVGIFIHHSDIERKIRFEIETICSDIKLDTPSQIIFATETLSYGVNLAVQDVILVGTEFYSQTRFRELQIEWLSTSAYHNMVGRAGRKGKIIDGRTAHAYIMVPDNTKPISLVRSYYKGIEPAQSRLYVIDDKNVQYNAENNCFGILREDTSPCAKYASLGASDFSYPFVRTVLDALRHLNTEGSNGSGDSNTGVNKDTLIKNLLSMTLYAHQYLSPNGETTQRERELFNCAVERILDDCATPKLELVKVDESKRSYFITPLGESIIDTGTEISTVEPLLEIVRKLNEAWKQFYANKEFPTDLYLLGIIAQREVFRQYIRYAPECKKVKLRNWPEQLAAENFKRVLKLSMEALEKIGVPKEESESLAECLRRNILDKREWIGQVEANYLHGASDSLLRLFSGIIAWINGEERTLVYKQIEGNELGEAYEGKMQKFRQFTELLNFKILFLSKMLSKLRSGELSLGIEAEKNLHILASRLRFGCTAEAVPLFWPSSSNISRPEAAKLLAAKGTPSRFLAVAKPQDIIPNSLEILPRKLKLLREDLEKHAYNKFKELEDEMIIMPIEEQNQQKREAARSLFEDIGTLFKKSIKQFSVSNTEENDFDGLLRQHLNFPELDESLTPILDSSSRSLGSDRYRIRIVIPEGEAGMEWHGERLSDAVLSYEEGDHEDAESQESRYDEQQIVKIIGIQFRHSWECRLGLREWQPFHHVLADHQSTKHLVIVPLPWTPLRENMLPNLRGTLEQRAAYPGYSTTFVTPAAFAVIVILIVRGFISGEAYMKMLVESPRSNKLINVVTVENVREIIERLRADVPSVIREKLIGHFEVDVDI